MSRRACMILPLAATSLLLSACVADDSLPSRPRTAGPLQPSEKAQQNAEQRTLEQPSRDLPTGGGREFPGQTKAPTANDTAVVTLDSSSGSDPFHDMYEKYRIRDFSGPSGWEAFGHTVGPTTTYNRDHYSGPLPHLPENPGSVPMTGSIMAPDGDWPVDFSWGQGLVLENAPHRAWPETTAYYKDAIIYHNPVYYFNLQEHMDVAQDPGTCKGDWISTAYEVPWFYFNTAILPILMALEPPLAQRMTVRTSQDPNFLAHLPKEGPVVPAPYAGQLKWTYPFLNPDMTIRRSDAGTQPAQ
jgi:hypothetical protein